MLAYDCRGTPRDSFEARGLPCAAGRPRAIRLWNTRYPGPRKPLRPKQRSCCKAFRSPARARSESHSTASKPQLPPA